MSKMVDILAEAFAMAEVGKTAFIKEKLAELDEVKIKVYRETEDVKLPTYAHDDDACMDVYVHDIEIKDDGRIIYHTGLHFKLPEDYEMEIRPRSSLTKTTSIMQNAPGTLDEGYTGELMIVHRRINIDSSLVGTPEFNIGDKVAQILVRRRERIKFKEVDIIEDLGDTERGDGGFGSTGK